MPTKKAVKPVRAKVTRPGRPKGAAHLDFKELPGSGAVTMQTMIRGENRVKISITDEQYEMLKKATGGHLYTSALAALAQWALKELRKQGKNLVVYER